jgi:hypothetical protein
MPNKRPNSRRNLDAALERIVGRANLVDKRVFASNATDTRLVELSFLQTGEIPRRDARNICNL